MTPCRGLFVVGTDTGVGKTRVAAAIAWSLTARGSRVGVLKPVATGSTAAGASWRCEDAEALIAAIGGVVPVERVARCEVARGDDDRARLAPAAAGGVDGRPGAGGHEPTRGLLLVESAGATATVEARWAALAGERNFSQMCRTMQRLLDELDPKDSRA